jgi:serine/threonine-protein kinase HipA
MMRKLNVFLAGQLVGELEQDASGRVRFGYHSGWLASERAAPLSASLPLRPERFRWKECRPFFAGLLPEDESRQLIAKALGISDRNDFALLEKIGAECAGAVSLLRPGEPPLPIGGQYREIASDELADKFAELPRRPLLAGEDRIRLSLAGAQGKFPCLSTARPAATS